MFVKLLLRGFRKDSFHQLDNIKGDAKLTQENSTLVMTGENRLHTLHANTVLSVTRGSSLYATQLGQTKHLDAYYLNGNVYLGQSTIALTADQIIAHNFIRSGSEKTFESVVLKAKNVEINGTINAKTGLVQSDELLRLKQAELMGHVFYLLSKGKIETENSTLDAKEAYIVANDGQLNSTDFKGGSHQIHIERHLDALGSTIHVDQLGVQAQTAQLPTLNTHAETAHIKLSEYRNGIEGVIKLAHDLMHCKHVSLDAKNESLTITQDTYIRPNVAFALNRVDIQADLKSHGSLAIETENGIRVTGAVYAHNVNLTANHGDIEFYKAVLDAVEDLHVQTRDGNIFGQSGSYTAGRDIGIDSANNAHFESPVSRIGLGNNYHDVIDIVRFGAGRKINMRAGGTLHFGVVKTASGQDTTLVAKTFIDEAKALESHSEFNHGKEWGVHHSVHHARSTHESGGSYTVTTLADQHHQAPIINAKEDIRFHSGGKVNIYNVIDSNYDEHHSRGKRKSVDEISLNRYSVGAHLHAQIIEGIAVEDINITHGLYDAQHTILKSAEGIIRIMLGKNESSYSRTMSHKSVAWNRLKMQQEHDETYSQARFTGTLETHAKKLELQQVAGQSLEFMKHATHYGGDVTYEYLKEVHDVISIRVQGPSPAVTALIAISFAIATGGTGLAGVGAGATLTTAQIATQVLSAMSQSAFSALYTQATVATLSNDGNINKALRTFNSDTFKNIALTAAAAGVTKGIALNYGMNATPSTFTKLPEYTKYYGLQAGVNTAINIASGQNIKDAALSGVKNGAINAVTTLVANTVSDVCEGNAAGEIGLQTSTAYGLGHLLYRDGDAALANAIGAFSGSVGNHLSSDRPTESTTENPMTKEQTQHNRTFNSRISQLPRLMAVLATMVFDVTDSHNLADQMAETSFSGGRNASVRKETLEKEKIKQELIKAKKAEAEIAEKKRLEEEAQAKTDKQKERERVKKEKAKSANQQKQPSQKTVSEGAYLGSDQQDSTTYAQNVDQNVTAPVSTETSKSGDSEVKAGGYLGSNQTDQTATVSNEPTYKNGEPVIPHKMNGETIYLQISQEEYTNYKAKYTAWEQRDSTLQLKINDRVAYYEHVGRKDPWNTVEVQALSNQRVFNRFARPNTPPRALGAWSEGNTKNTLKQTGRSVGARINRACKFHNEDWKNLKDDPLNAHNLIKAPVTLINEALGTGLSVVGEIITPVTDKLSSVARQSLRGIGVKPQVASDVVYGAETVNDIYMFGKSAASLASRVSKGVSTASNISKTKNVTLLNASKIGSLDDMILGYAYNKNIIRINQFDKIKLKVPANGNIPNTVHPIEARAPVAMTGTGSNSNFADAIAHQRIARNSVYPNMPSSRGVSNASLIKMSGDAPRATSNGATSHNVGATTSNPTTTSLTMNGGSSGLRPKVGSSGGAGDVRVGSLSSNVPLGGSHARLSTINQKFGLISPAVTRPSKIHDYSKYYYDEAKNFINESPKEFNGTLSNPLRMVSYHSDSAIGPGGRSLKYWAPVPEAHAMGTIEDVVNRLALLNEWEVVRSHVSVAEIPAGVSVKFLHGKAALQKGKINPLEERPGGSVQYCFEKFDEAWVKVTRELP